MLLLRQFYNRLRMLHKQVEHFHRSLTISKDQIQLDQVVKMERSFLCGISHVNIFSSFLCIVCSVPYNGSAYVYILLFYLMKCLFTC